MTPNINQINHDFLGIFRHVSISEMSNMKENAKRIDNNVVHLNTWNSVWQITYVYWMLDVIIWNV